MTGVASPLMVSLNRALDSESPSLISIEGYGSISIYPRQHSYTTDIRNWDSLPFLDDARVKVSACVWGGPSAGGMPVSELQWLAAYQHARRLASAEPPLRGLVKLQHWPDLADVPEELAAPIVRICALLWRKPTASTLVPRVLGAEPAPTDALLRVLQGFGHVEIATGFADRVEADTAAAAAEAEAASARANGAVGAVLGKLWQRLLGR